MPTRDGQTLIDEKFLSRRDLFALEFTEGLVFLEVRDWEFLQYRPYDGVDTISAQSSKGETILQDGNGDEIVYMDKGVEKVLHGSIGVYPNTMRMYTRYPEGSKKLGTWPNLNTASSSSGDDYGFISGEDSPYKTPTDELELFVPPGVEISHEFFNPEDRPREPKLNLRFRKYKINALDWNNDGHKKSIKRILSPGSPMPIAPVGTFDNKYSYDLQDTWGVRPMPRSQAFKIVEGGV